MSSSPQQLELRNLKIYRRYIAGETRQALADEFKISAWWVRKICRKVEAAYVSEAVQEVTAVKKLESAKLEILFREAMNAWQRSQNPRERRRVRTVKKGVKEEAGKAAEVVDETAELVTEGRDGNPRFLEVAVKIRGDIRKIWGADAIVEWANDDLQARALVTTMQHQAAIADEQARQIAGDDFESLCPPVNRLPRHVRSNGNAESN